MSKGDGLKIGIKFTEDLVGDVSGSEDAFTITGKEYKYVNGPLVNKEYQVDKVERYPVPKKWVGDFSVGTLLGTDIFEGSLILGKEGDV